MLKCSCARLFKTSDHSHHTWNTSSKKKNSLILWEPDSFSTHFQKSRLMKLVKDPRLLPDWRPVVELKAPRWLFYPPASLLDSGTVRVALLAQDVTLANDPLFVPREQPIYTTRAHVFQIDPTTKKNWVPASKQAVTVSYFYDSTRNSYRIISVDACKVRVCVSVCVCGFWRILLLLMPSSLNLSAWLCCEFVNPQTSLSRLLSGAHQLRFHDNFCRNWEDISKTFIKNDCDLQVFPLNDIKPRN